MKKLSTLWLGILFSCLQIVYAQDASRSQEKLKYLANTELEKGLSFAKEKSKPTMIYFSLLDCPSCERFTAAVLSNDSMEKVLKSKYVCLRGNIRNGDASALAKKYDVINMPQLVFISPDQEFHLTIDMKLDLEYTIKVAHFFLNLVALRNQIILYQKTNNIDWEKACEAMAGSYARRDFKKNMSADPKDLIYSRCLNQKKYLPFEKAYLEEWETQKSKKK